MIKCKSLFIFFLAFFPFYDLSGLPTRDSDLLQFLKNNDTLEKQILYNGRVWRNLYYHVKGDQFLFSNNFLNGSVTMDGTLFKNLMLQYDIFKDEILIPTYHGYMLQLNKEKVDKFTIDYQNKTYHFERFDVDSLINLSGYVNILYGGQTSLLVKYKKEQLFLAYYDKYDSFNQIQRIFIKKDGKIFPVNSRKDFLNLLKDHKQQIRSFIKTNKLHVTKKNPDSFIPVVEYYDKLNHQI